MKFYPILVIFFAINCSNPIEKQNIKFNIHQHTIKLEEPTPANPWYVQYIESDSGDNILLFNHFKDKFQFLDFNSGKTILQIPIQREGDHGIPGFKLGTALSHDSIWFTSSPPGIGLMNFKGEVLKQKKITDDLIPLTSISSAYDRSLYQFGHKIFGPQPLFMDHHKMNNNDIKNQRLIFSYDILNGKVTWYNVFYRDNYWTEGKKPSGFSWTARNDKLYISPYYDHEIQVFDLKSKKVIDKMDVISNSVKKFNYVNQIPAPGEALKNRFSSDRYGALLYDKYRDIFYRLIWPSFNLDDLDEDYNHEDLELSRPYLGVMVLDKEMNFLGEHRFARFQIFASWNHFVGKKGLYLSTNNVYNPEYNEDELRYLIFTPELESD
ncbi:DUF4221 family protein [Pleomorphovibrio marinus]|uniref:DUF4221 family protein n=1 Tax=Pleomorphovibrio marinus TaxID=2164132 RepID=UPI000E0BB862|nr:DUF4221 family protein [Pleomorphovibrio marinus]